jgi:hypothetical protein
MFNAMNIDTSWAHPISQAMRGFGWLEWAFMLWVGLEACEVALPYHFDAFLLGLVPRKLRSRARRTVASLQRFAGDKTKALR